MTTNKYYIGIMSGTSLDAVDVALVDFETKRLEVIATHAEPIPKALKQDVLALCYPGENAIQRMGEADVKLGRLFSKTVLQLLKKEKLSAKDIVAIGSHGQTIRHVPDTKFPFTLQIGDPNIIAAKTDITVVADFRRRDIALGGQAAPLAPAFHNYLFRDSSETVGVLNIGGIANLTVLPADPSQTVIGFDTGPGNTLMDAWYQKHQRGNYDKDGKWATSGRCNQALLQRLLSDTYFKKAPPKSTGREYFHLDWLQPHIPDSIQTEDVQATLLQLTARSISDTLHLPKNKITTLWLCGGGTHNQRLVQQLQQFNKNIKIQSTENMGINPDWIEATAFAWLARQTLNKKPGNIPSVTGAKTSSILGAIFRKN